MSPTHPRGSGEKIVYNPLRGFLLFKTNFHFHPIIIRADSPFDLLSSFLTEPPYT